jgi:hypothetical protein
VRATDFVPDVVPAADWGPLAPRQSVLDSVNGDQDRAVDKLLGMSDPEYKEQHAASTVSGFAFFAMNEWLIPS